MRAPPPGASRRCAVLLDPGPSTGIPMRWEDPIGRERKATMTHRSPPKFSPEKAGVLPQAAGDARVDPVPGRDGECPHSAASKGLGPRQTG